MIDKTKLAEVVGRALEGSELYLVDLKVTPSNEIEVTVDSPSGVDIDSCAALTRKIEEAFDREVEDYQLEVGSAGITSPLKVYRQYEQNLGKDMVVLTRDGRKLRGVLASARQTDEADPTKVEFSLLVETKVKEPGAKRPTVKTVEEKFTSEGCKSVQYDLKF